MISRIRLILSSPALLCALTLAVCVAIAHPALEMGYDDDWSYIWSARALAQTGHIHYNGWSTAILGWQLYLGALFIKLFGFSFNVVRLPILLVSMGTVALLHRLFVRCGITSWNATLATLTVGLSPLFMPLAFSFMSDVPGFFCIILCLYMCVRAVQARTDRAAVTWLALAALSNVVGGTARQIAWLGVLVIVPCTSWLLRRRRGALMAGALSCFAGVCFIFICMHWFGHQPYTIIEKPISFPEGSAAQALEAEIVVKSFLACFLFILPVLVAFLWKYPLRLRRPRIQIVIAEALILCGTLFEMVRHKVFLFTAPLIGYNLGTKGIPDVFDLPGQRPHVLTYQATRILGFLVLSALAACILCLWNGASLGTRATPTGYHLSRTAMLQIFTPFSAAYILLLVTRERIFDRYLLAVVVVLLILLLRFYQERLGDRLPPVCVLVLAIFTCFTIAGMHDHTVLGRARLAAANQILAAGEPRSDLRAGFEYDAWTELELKGYINDKRLVLPPGSYQPPPPSPVPMACTVFFSDHTPSVHARYIMVHEPLDCLAPSQFPPIPYRTWLPPHQHQIITEQVPQS